MFEKHVCNSWMIDACNVWTRFCSSKRPFQTGPSVSGLCKRSDGTLQNWLQTTPTDWGGQGSLGLAASGGWISSFNERTLTTKCKVDFEIFFKIHPIVFGDRWDIIKQPDGWEPTMNWTIDVKFCLSWNWRQSTLSATLIGHLRWHHGQHSQMCLHTSEGRTKVKLSHWQCWNTPSLSTFILFICTFLFSYFSWPSDSNLRRNCPCFFWFRAPVAVLPGDIFGFGSLRNDADTVIQWTQHQSSEVAECKEPHGIHLYTLYTYMIYLRCEVCKKQTLKHSWSLCFQTIFLIVQVVTNTTIRTPSTTTTATTTLTLNSRLVRMTLKQELWGDGLKRCLWKASAAESILQVYVHQRRSLATMEVHCAD